MLKPYLDNVVIKKLPEEEEKTESGIIIKDIMRRKIAKGIVLASGPDAEHIKPGDKVIYVTVRETEIEKDTIVITAGSVALKIGEVDLK